MPPSLAGSLRGADINTMRRSAGAQMLVLVLAMVAAGCGGPTAPSSTSDIPPYDRDDWPHWIDTDRDCQDTRQEVLIEESLEPVVFVDASRCRVASGLWRDAYSGQMYRDPGALDIDHLVPLANAHASGGWQWFVDRKRDYANDLIDPNHLVAVLASLNRQKGSQTPATWKPPDRTAWCWYARAWSAVKSRWMLSIANDERAALAEMQAGC